MLVVSDHGCALQSRVFSAQHPKSLIDVGDRTGKIIEKVFSCRGGIGCQTCKSTARSRGIEDGRVVTTRAECNNGIVIGIVESVGFRPAIFVTAFEGVLAFCPAQVIAKGVPGIDTLAPPAESADVAERQNERSESNLKGNAVGSCMQRPGFGADRVAAVC